MHDDGRRWIGAEWGMVWGGVSPLQPTRGSGGDLGECRELPQRRPGWSPGRKRILAYFEGHRMLIFVLFLTKSAGDNLHYRPLLQILGRTCPPCPPVMNNTVENDFFGFPKVKWLQYTDKVGKCTCY